MVAQRAVTAHPWAVYFVPVFHFKHINDSLGIRCDQIIPSRSHDAWLDCVAKKQSDTVSRQGATQSSLL